MLEAILRSPHAHARIRSIDTSKAVALSGVKAVMTGADLPNAFPYFIAIERIVNADVSTMQALLVIAGYALIYCLPCLLLLVAGAARGDRVRRRLAGLYERLGAEKKQPRNLPVAAGYLAAAAGVLVIAFLV